MTNHSCPPSCFHGLALEYFRCRATDPLVAATFGVRQEANTIVFPYRTPDGAAFERRRSLNGDGPKVRQPKGSPLTLWRPRPLAVGDTAALLCEGESDALAALTALGSAPLDDLRTTAVYAVPGTGMPTGRVASELTAEGVTQVWMVLDADDAGRKFRDKLVPDLLAAGVTPFVVGLPDGCDLADVLAGMAPEDRGKWIVNSLLDAETAGEDSPAADARGVLEAIERFLSRYVVLPGDHEAVALALFTAHTHAFEAAFATPYLCVLSPERRSGKTLLLELLELIVSRPWRIVSASESAMFRKIADVRPTLLLDEIDAIFGSNSERTEPLRAILNAGNRPGSAVARCVGEGSKQRVVDFEVYGPKVLAGIDTGRLPDTIRDRAIEIRMKRKTAMESVERFRRRQAERAAEALREEIARWAAQDLEVLRDAEPDLPADLNDRAAEAWESLLAIADRAGGRWPERAREAAVALARGAAIEEASQGTRILAKLRDLFRGRSGVSTDEVVTAINRDEELPFGAWRDGRGIDARALARLLKPYGLRPRTIRLPDGTTPKGYHRDEIAEEAFRRYLPPHDTDPPHENPYEYRDVADVARVADFSRGKGEGEVLAA